MPQHPHEVNIPIPFVWLEVSVLFLVRTAVFFPSGLLKSFAEEILDLSVHAPEFIIGPLLKLAEKPFIKA